MNFTQVDISVDRVSDLTLLKIEAMAQGGGQEEQSSGATSTCTYYSGGGWYCNTAMKCIDGLGGCAPPKSCPSTCSGCFGY